MSKNSTGSKNFYLLIYNLLKDSTNLSKIQEKLSISKQQLNYYLRRLVKDGLIEKRGRGWYEVVKEVKISTKYGNSLVKDSIRGHAYIWTIKVPQETKGWDKRIKILDREKIHYNLVGALKTTPRIKILGRKVWLCNHHLRIYDKKGSSYYGETAIQSRYQALQTIKMIVGALNRKLGLSLKPINIRFRKEHYALIKNDLAIHENKQGNIIRIKDKDGEWLLIDDSLEQGGELENVGKKAFKTNVPMQNWWNNHKKNNFKVTPSFILESINKVTQNQQMFAKNIEKHMEVLQEIGNAIKELRGTINGNNKI